MEIKSSTKRLTGSYHKNLIWSLERDSIFEKEVVKIRKQIKLGQLDDNDIQESVILLLENYKLPLSWLPAVKQYIINNNLNVFDETEINLNPSGYTADIIKGNESPTGKNRKINITITGNVSKTRLKKWIDQNWEDINFWQLTLNLPSSVHRKWRQTNLVKRIIKLKDVNKMTFSQITDRLGMMSEDRVKHLYKRYKK